MSLPMHVVHVNFAKNFRGGERQTLNLMQELVGHGIKQSLVCRPDGELAQRAIAAGISVIPVGHPAIGHLGIPPCTLTHVHEARGAYWAGLEALFRNTPYLITRRIPNPVSTGIATRSVYRHADAVVAVSADIARHLQHQIGRPPRVILDGPTQLVVDAIELAQIKQRCGTGPVIGHVGALQDHHKGQSVLIAAFQQLAETIPNARLLLVGHGPDLPLFKKLSKDDPRIIFAGFQDEVGAWLAAMDLFVFPSREEGLGSSVLDAMLLGIPVIAANVGGLPELIGSNERGWLVSGHDPTVWATAMHDALSNTEQTQQFIHAGRKFAQSTSSAAMAIAYLAIYQQIRDRKAALT